MSKAVTTITTFRLADSDDGDEIRLEFSSPRAAEEFAARIASAART